MEAAREKLLEKAYSDYINMALYDFPIERIGEIVVEDITGYGTTRDEKVLEIKRLRQMIIDQRLQGAGIEMQFAHTPIHRRVNPAADIAIYTDEFEISMILEEGKNAIQLRLTSVFEFNDNTWKLVHFHGSSAVETEGDTWHLNEWQKKNEELHRLVDEKTADLEKKNRELEIEAALERVRTHAMAMQSSDDLAKIVEVVFSELKRVGFQTIRAGIGIIESAESKKVNIWSTTLADEDLSIQVSGDEILEGHPLLEGILEHWVKQAEFSYELEGKDMLEYYSTVEKTNFHLPDYARKNSSRDAKQYYYMFPCAAGGIYAFSTVPFTAEVKKLLRRFIEVFQLAYTRYADLKKAEAQTREAQVEAALERVRSKSMAMHKSEELRDAATLLYTELRNLGIERFINCGYVLIDEENNVQNAWMTHTDGTIREVHQMPLTGDDIMDERYAMWKKKVPIFKQKVGGEKLRIHNAFASGQNDTEMAPENKLLDLPDPTVFYFGNFSEGYLHLLTEEEFSKESEAILSRFTKVFENTFRRFLDLQKAEEQAREAQVELSLERIRAQVTAMRESSELLDIVVTMNSEFKALGHEAHYFWHMRWLPDTYQKAMTSGDGSRIGMVMELPRGFHEDTRMLEWEKNNEPVGIFTYDVDAAIDYVDKMVMLGRFDLVDHNAPGPDDIRAINGLTFVMARTTHGEIGYSLPGEVPNPPEEDLATLVRFAGVFDLAYRRFEDLKSAEQRNRETQIELALEKVRSKTMAMHNSNDVGDTVVTLFDEVLKLGLDKSIRVGIGILEGNERMETWSATSYPNGEVDLKMGMLDMTIHPMLVGLKKAWKSGKKGYSYHYIGDDVVRYYTALNNEPDYPFFVDLDTLPENEYHKSFFYSEGILFSFAPNPISGEAAEVLDRFARVFGQTYRRYRDLQKAEEQALEALKQASLDRVRGQIASMRNSEDLRHITPLIWRELTTLEVPFFRCGVFIINEKEKNVHVYLSTPDGKALAALNLAFDFSDLTRNTVASWRRKEVYQEHWDKEKFVSWTKEMMKIRQITTAEDYQGDPTPPESLHLHFIPFEQGMLYVGNTGELDGEKLGLVKSLAEAFSYAYARYEDFVVLEEAKEHLEKTLIDLKATQSQLVHAEKMASLGELTAGIAHEIQNPLNFVNNFSEISIELIEELAQASAVGSRQSAAEIIDDIIQNLQKINFHGKRASDIVKGMLQHSRNNSGEKIPTDINALADEYLRLAYHGLRAKDKSFNADFKLEAEENLPRVNVVPQDIGRVLLNLINNGFYAVNKRSKEENGAYRPQVVVSTKLDGNKIEVRVVDNGQGIPDEIKDKVFQPFFTTKPTGEGTGLGLSMSYEIITKGHGGKMNVETTVGQGTKFIIELAV